MPAGDLISELLRRASSSPPDLLAADIAAVLADHGADRVTLYVVDFGQTELRPVEIAAELLAEPTRPVPLTGTMAGRAFETQQVLHTLRGAGSRVWVPISERADRTGVVEIDFERPVTDEVLEVCEHLGRTVSYLVATASKYTDVIDLQRRRRQMTMSADLQWDMLIPPLAFRTGAAAIAGVLEPAYEVAGDALDYALNGEHLHFAIFDAMGHGLRSALASVLAISAFRYGRRRVVSLPEIAGTIDEALRDQFGGEVFVTGHLARLDTATGELLLLNAGHPSPLLVRGHRVVAELTAEPILPFGLEIKVAELGRWQLQPGDAVLFYSDGVTEARPNGGEEFGLPRMRSLLESTLAAPMAPGDALRRLIEGVLDHRQDVLTDDATVAFVQWRP